MHSRLIEIWHLSQTALAGKPFNRYDRLQYVTAEYMRENPHAKRKQVWLEADVATRPSVIMDLQDIVDRRVV
jgi:hypothetical protein